MFEAIKRLLKAVWNFIKKIVLKLVSFVRNIVSFFRDPSRLRKLQEDKNKIAVAIKERLDSGEYQVVNCLYDQSTNDLVTPNEDAVVMSAEELDAETMSKFGDKDMMVIK